jgi:hypothetical protein
MSQIKCDYCGTIIEDDEVIEDTLTHIKYRCDWCRCTFEISKKLIFSLDKQQKTC